MPLRDPLPVPEKTAAMEDDPRQMPRVEQLERELQRMRDDLERSIRDLRDANEKLQASNEVLRSTNEELQAANAELEAGKKKNLAAHEALARAHHDRENLLRSTEIAVIFLDDQLTIQSFTPAIAQVYNVMAGDIGRPIEHITHQAARMPPLPDPRWLREQNAPVEEEVLLADGRTFLRRVMPYRTTRDDGEGIVVTFTDVSRIKEVERRAERLAALVQSSQDAIIGLSLDGVITSWNPGAEQMYGWTAAEAIGRTIDLIIPDDGRAERHRLFRRLMDGAAIELFETAHLTKFGALVNVLISHSPIFDARGSQAGVSAIARDITARKRGQRALRESQQQLKAVVEAALDAILLMDEQGRIIDFNPAAEKTFGYSRDAVIGRLLAETIIPKRYRAQHEAAFQRYLRTGVGSILNRRLELAALRADGSEFPIELTITATASEGRPPFFTGNIRDLTQQWRAEQALRDSEARLKSILANTSSCVFAKDLDGRYTIINQRMLDLFGWSSEASVLGKTDCEIHAPEDAAVYVENDRQVVATGEPMQFEEVARRPDGDRIYLMQKFPLRTASGEVYGVCGIATDITERKHAEEAVRQSEERLRFTLHAARVGAWDWNIETDEVKWSDNLEALHGRPPGSFRGRLQDVLQEVYPPDQENLQRTIQQALAGDGQYEVEYRFLRADGTLGWLHGQGRATFNHAGRPIRMAGICMDVSEQRRSNEHTRILAEAGALLSGSMDFAASLSAVARLLVPAVGDWCAIDLIDEENHLQQVAVIHSDPERIALAHELRRRYPPDLEADEGIGRVVRTRRRELYPLISDELLQRSARDEKHLEMLRALGLHSALIVPMNVLAQTVGVITLVSAESHRRYNERDVRLIEELASRCALAVQNARLYLEAQHEIDQRRKAEENLRQASVAAEVASRSKSEFLANMSHEIRTPMTAILGYADLLRQHLDDPDNLQCVETIRRNGEFLLEIIGDILDLSRIEAGKLRVEKARFAPDELIAEIRSLMDVRAAEKNLPLVIDYQGPLPQSIESDPTRLRQILVNLIGNAIKFTDSGSVRLTVCMRQEALDALPTTESSGRKSGELEFRIIDTGIGMTRKQQDRLFEPFSQADASVTRRYGGSGLGLSISRRLAEMLGGRITVGSEPNKGSTFTLTIATGNLEGVPLVEPRQEIVSPVGRQLRPRRLDCSVLVVDDRREVRHLVQHFLEEAGARVVTAGHGQQALEEVDRIHASGDRIDLILLDMQMPVMDGYEAAARLRRGGFDGPIVALTAHAMKGDEQLCLAAGCDAYATKPIDGRHLVEIVARYTQDVSVDELRQGRLDRRAAPQRGETARPHLADASEPRATETRRVLIVDDSPDACRALELLLRSRGHDIAVAHDGKTALEAAAQQRPDVVLLDLTLPDMSGHEVASRLRQSAPTARALLIAVSGHDSPEDFQRSREAGFDHHVVKPAKIDALERLFHAAPSGTQR